MSDASYLVRTSCGLVCLLSMCLLAAPANTRPDREPAPSSSFWIEGGGDSADTREGNATLELGIGQADTLRIGAGGT